MGKETIHNIIGQRIGIYDVLMGLHTQVENGVVY